MTCTSTAARIERRAPEYGSIPFWSWNDRLDDDELRRQIRFMKSLRMGGFFMHARGGLETEYLSDEWFHAIEVSIDEAKKVGMQAWAYDENGWPSGFAGGKLLKDRRNWAVGLFCDEVDTFPDDEDTVAAYVCNPDGSFSWAKAPVAGCNRYLRIHLQRDCSYIDALDPRITREFLQATHEEYLRRLPAGDFGSVSMPGFFTDEPQYFRWGHTYSLTLPDAFRETYGYELFLGLPALFHRDVPGGAKFRYDYFKLIHERFIECWVKIVHEWCAGHGVKLTGHTVEESSLGGQMMCCGGAMPFYEYEDIPGIDYLGRGIAADIAPRQLGSVCAQLGKPKALSEMYGCCGWDVTPPELKRIADLQYAGGVNLMCQHLVPYSNRGQRKREYPAHYSEHNPWAASLAAFDLHYDRLGAALSDGAEYAPVLVVHPMHGAYMQYRKDVNWHEEIERRFFELSALLGENQVPYHYGDEWLMRKYGSVKDGRLFIGNCAYELVVVPFTYTLDASTCALLKEFLSQGGRLWLFDAAPACVDGLPSDTVSWLRATATWDDVLALRDAVLSAPEGVKDIRKMTRRLSDGSSIVFLANVGTVALPCVSVDFPGASRAYELDLDGPAGAPAPARAVHGEPLHGGGIRLSFRFGDCESHLLVVDGPADETPALLPGCPELPASTIPVPAAAAFASTPENAIPLDIAERSDDGVRYDAPLSLYGIKDNLLRERRDGDVWLRFRFTLADGFRPAALRLALEPMRESYVAVNGAEIRMDPKAWWWDRSFATADIAPLVRPGENELVVKLRHWQRPEVYHVLFGDSGFEALRNCLDFDTEIEVPYLVGDFAVRSSTPFAPGERDSKTTDGPFTLGPQRDRVSIADVVSDGYPFFCGRLRVSFPYEYRKGGATVLELGGRFATCRVSVDGADAGEMLLSRSIDLANFLREGANEIGLELVGTCRNLMGPHHRWDPEPWGVGPNTFSFEREWNGRECPGYAPRYAFVRFGVE